MQSLNEFSLPPSFIEQFPWVRFLVLHILFVVYSLPVQCASVQTPCVVHLAYPNTAQYLRTTESVTLAMPLILSQQDANGCITICKTALRLSGVIYFIKQNVRNTSIDKKCNSKCFLIKCKFVRYGRSISFDSFALGLNNGLNTPSRFTFPLIKGFFRDRATISTLLHSFSRIPCIILLNS